MVAILGMFAGDLVTGGQGPLEVRTCPSVYAAWMIDVV
jgi:hypothetical protein